jgi:hypothetical protein
MECFDIKATDREVLVACSAGLLVLGHTQHRIYNPATLHGKPSDIPQLLKDKRYS